MSEDQLYQLARKRIQRRNRRWFIWGADFLAFLVYIGAYTILDDSADIGLVILFAWAGVVILHGVMIGMAQNLDQEVEKEVARLRSNLDDEKPKRLALDEDGELIDFGDESLQKRRQE